MFTIIGIVVVFAGFAVYVTGIVLIYDPQWSDTRCDKRTPVLGAVIIGFGATMLSVPMLVYLPAFIGLTGTQILLEYLAARDKRCSLKPAADADTVIFNEIIEDIGIGRFEVLKAKVAVRLGTTFRRE